MNSEIIRTKKWNLLFCDGVQSKQAARELSDATGLSEVMSRLLLTRGLSTPEKVRSFLRQEDALLHDPYQMRDIPRAVERIRLAIDRKEKIAIYGDYDVDGVTSVSLLYLYLTEHFDADVGYYIPSRSREGYGLSAPAIDRLKERGVRLMITVDTGITANEETEYAAKCGIETVITDHHECRDPLPDAVAVVNPHRPDDEYPFKELAGVGVVFKLICAMETALCREKGISEIDGIRAICDEYADLVAIGTIADVMPIIDENRLIVARGLKLLETTKRPGLRALMEAANGGKDSGKKKPRINSGFIGFAIAPRMNAAGRVSSASIAVELLLATERTEAERLADQLCELNFTRQVEENKIAEQAYKKIEQTLDPERDRVIVLEDDNWQQGIIGIVSSRITERYGLPSILISFDGATRGFPEGDDVGKGSGRSVRGINLVEALTCCEEYLVRFGGHELAAGLSIRRRDIDAFRERFNRYVEEHLDEEMMCSSVDADCAVEVRDLTMGLAKEIEMLEPFGISNPVPNLILSSARVVRISPLGNGKHTKLLLEKDGVQMNAVWFGTPATRLPFEVNDPVDVLFQLNINEFQNTVSLQMIVQDMRLSPEFEANLDAMKRRYEEIRNGGVYAEDEDVCPNREDIAAVYTALRKEFRNGNTAFSMRRLLGMFSGGQANAINYVKLKMIIRIMQELQICGVMEPTEDSYVFDFYFNVSKTNIEKSSILKRLKAQMRKEPALSVRERQNSYE